MYYPCPHSQSPFKWCEKKTVDGMIKESEVKYKMILASPEARVMSNYIKKSRQSCKISEGKWAVLVHSECWTWPQGSKRTGGGQGLWRAKALCSHPSRISMGKGRAELPAWFCSPLWEGHRVYWTVSWPKVKKKEGNRTSNKWRGARTRQARRWCWPAHISPSMCPYGAVTGW